MKFHLLLSALALNSAIGGSSIEGEVSISGLCDGKLVSFSCEWKARSSRRNLRHMSRELDVSAEFRPHCEVEICDEDGDNCDDVDLEDRIPDEDVYTVVETDADGADDYYRFSTSIDLDPLNAHAVVTLELVDKEIDGLTYDDSDAELKCP